MYGQGDRGDDNSHPNTSAAATSVFGFSDDQILKALLERAHVIESELSKRGQKV